MILNNINEIRKLLTASKSLTFDRLEPFIEDSEDDLQKVIGNDFYTELDAYTGSDAIILKAISLVKKSLAFTMYFKGYDMLNVVFSNQGVHRIETEDGGKKALFQRQEENLKDNFKIHGYNKLDKFLTYLEENKASFPTWTASSEYTLAKRNFINSTDEFNSYFNINSSRLVFLKLRNFQKIAEDFTILPLIGRAFFDELKTQIASDTLTAWNTAFLNFLKPAVAHATIYHGNVNLINTLTDFGIVKFENETNARNFKTRKQTSDNDLHTLIANAKNTSNNYINICAAYLKENINEFPTYSASSAYDADANLYDRPEGTDKIELAVRWFEAVENLPVVWQLLLYSLTALVFLLIALMRFRKFRDIVFSFFETYLSITFRTKITSHDIFFRMSYYDNIINKIDLNSEAKTFSIKSILKNKSKIVISEMKIFFKDNKWKKFNNAELFNFYVESINSSVRKYKSAIKDSHVKKYGQNKGVQLYNYVYIKGFEPLHNKSIDDIINRIEELSKSQLLKNKDKTVIFLTFIMMALDSAIVDAEKAFKRFNGEPDRIVNSL